MCMNDRFQDPNWGPYGNPNHDTQTPRHLNELEFRRWSNSSAERPIFYERSNDNRITVWTVIFVLSFIIILGGFSETARGVIFYGINLTETWYSSVDSMLDALGAPKLP